MIPIMKFLKVDKIPSYPYQLHIGQSLTHHSNRHSNYHIHSIQSSDAVPATKLIHVAVQMSLTDFVKDALITTF